MAGRAGTAVADDLVADVFLVAWEQRAGFGPTRAGPKAWLYGIATNLLRRHHRSEETRLRAWVRDGGRRSTQDEVDHRVAHSVDADVRARRMAEALAGLRAEERDVLLLVTAGALSSGLCCRCRSALARRLGDERDGDHRGDNGDSSGGGRAVGLSGVAGSSVVPGAGTVGSQSFRTAVLPPGFWGGPP